MEKEEIDLVILEPGFIEELFRRINREKFTRQVLSEKGVDGKIGRKSQGKIRVFIIHSAVTNLYGVTIIMDCRSWFSTRFEPQISVVEGKLTWIKANNFDLPAGSIFGIVEPNKD